MGPGGKETGVTIASTRAAALPRLLIGLLPPFGIGAVAWGVGLAVPILGAPVVAILIGLVVGQLCGQPAAWAAGVRFASRRILQASIVLLGAGMSLAQVARIGSARLPVMIGTLALGGILWILVASSSLALQWALAQF